MPSFICDICDLVICSQNYYSDLRAPQIEQETMSNRESTMDSQSFNNEEFDDLISSDNEAMSQRFSFTSLRIPCRILERSKRLFCSGVFLKGSALAVGFWNPWKGFRAIMGTILLLLDIYFFFDDIHNVFECKRLDTPETLNSWFCGNASTTDSSSSSLSAFLRGSDLLIILSLVSYFAVLMSNGAFFWCMWKLQRRPNDCVTLDKAFSTAGRHVWVKLNCTILVFGSCHLIILILPYLTFKIKVLEHVLLVFSFIPQWATLTSSWIFVMITSAMKECVTLCHGEIRNAVGCTLDDVIRLHKRLCKQMSSTSESLKVWFLIHWFLLAIVAVLYLINIGSLFKNIAPNWPTFCRSTLYNLTYPYVFVYTSYCAASVTTRCNHMLKELNMTTDDEWPTGHPFCSRSQLALFLQYAQYTNCGFQVGEVTFGTNFVWFSTLIAMFGVAYKVL